MSLAFDMFEILFKFTRRHHNLLILDSSLFRIYSADKQDGFQWVYKLNVVFLLCMRSFYGQLL